MSLIRNAQPPQPHHRHRRPDPESDPAPDQDADRRRRRPGPRPFVVLLVATSLAVACGTTTPAAQPTTTAPPATAPPATRDMKADEKVARDGLLRVDDLPGGPWKETKRSLSSEAEPSTADNPAAACPEAQAKVNELGLDRADPAATAKSSKFALGTGDATTSQVEETVEIRAREDDATSMANVFGDAALLKCLKNEVEKTLSQDSSGSSSKDVKVDAANVEVERVKVGSLGDDHAVFRITVPAETAGVKINVVVVAAFVRVGRGYANVSYVTYGGVDMTDDVMPVLDAATARLTRALQH